MPGRRRYPGPCARCTCAGLAAGPHRGPRPPAARAACLDRWRPAGGGARRRYPQLQGAAAPAPPPTVVDRWRQRRWARRSPPFRRLAVARSAQREPAAPPAATPTRRRDAAPTPAAPLVGRPATPSAATRVVAVLDRAAVPLPLAEGCFGPRLGTWRLEAGGPPSRDHDGLDGLGVLGPEGAARAAPGPAAANGAAPRHQLRAPCPAPPSRHDDGGSQRSQRSHPAARRRVSRVQRQR